MIFSDFKLEGNLPIYTQIKNYLSALINKGFSNSCYINLIFEGDNLIFSDFKLEGNLPIYTQIKNYLSALINKGLLPNGSKLPSTRELSQILDVSRNSVIAAYDEMVANFHLQGNFLKY